jgi:predicted deacetylase
MSPFIRLDDFPTGVKGWQPPLDNLAAILATFNRVHARYLLGVSPLLLRPGDVEWLNAHVASPGAVVMHGFDHRITYPDWPNVKNTWPHGGEFEGMTARQFLDRWTACDTILRGVERYDDTHFVPPFNAYTQAALDAMQETPVVNLHTLDTLHRELGQNKLNHGRLLLHIGTWERSYGAVTDVAAQYNRSGPTITLHWAFDSRTNPAWLQGYERLAKRIEAGT